MEIKTRILFFFSASVNLIIGLNVLIIKEGHREEIE